MFRVLGWNNTGTQLSAEDSIHACTAEERELQARVSGRTFPGLPAIRLRLGISGPTENKMGGSRYSIFSKNAKKRERKWLYCFLVFLPVDIYSGSHRHRGLGRHRVLNHNPKPKGTPVPYSVVHRPSRPFPLYSPRFVQAAGFPRHDTRETLPSPKSWYGRFVMYNFLPCQSSIFREVRCQSRGEVSESCLVNFFLLLVEYECSVCF